MRIFEEIKTEAKGKLMDMAYHNGLPMEEFEYLLNAMNGAVAIISFMEGMVAGVEMAEGQPNA